MPTRRGSAGTTRPRVRPRAGCAPTLRRCGSWRWWSTGRSRGRWQPHSILGSPRRMTQPKTEPPVRSSGGWPSTPRRGSVPGADSFRCPSRGSKQLPSGTTPPEPATRIDTFTFRSTRAFGPRASGAAYTPSVVATDGTVLTDRWIDELHRLGFRSPTGPTALHAARTGALDRDAAVNTVLSRLGAKRSAWNAADIRGQVELLISSGPSLN